MCNLVEYWASDFVYLTKFREFGENNFIVDGETVEVVETKPCKVQDFKSFSQCSQCRVKLEQAGLVERLRATRWDNPESVVRYYKHSCIKFAISFLQDEQLLPLVYAYNAAMKDKFRNGVSKTLLYELVRLVRFAALCPRHRAIYSV